jgi:hypothetical protein
MKRKNQIIYLKESVDKLQNSPEFRGLAVIILAIALEKQIKNVVIFNYRKSGLSASFVRSHLLKGIGYSELLCELDWCANFPEGKKIKDIWKVNKTVISDLFGVMKTRNRLIHSSGGVSPEAIASSVDQLLFVIEKLSEIFELHFGYNGLEPLPKTIKASDLNVSTKLFHKSIVKNRLDF